MTAFACVILFTFIAADSSPKEDVRGRVLRPSGISWKPIPAKAEKKPAKKEEKPPKPDSYNVHVGDLIELEYCYIRSSTTQSPKVNVNLTSNGAVARSNLGIRFVDTGLLDRQRIVFFFDAKKKGTDKVTLRVSMDDDSKSKQYECWFEVVER